MIIKFADPSLPAQQTPMHAAPQKIRYVKEASGAKSTTESFKYKSRDCDISQSESVASLQNVPHSQLTSSVSNSNPNLKQLIQIKEPYHQHLQQNMPLRKIGTPQKIQHIDRKIIERTYSSVRTMAPEKRNEQKIQQKQKKPIAVPSNSVNVIDESEEGGERSQKRRKSITFFELSCPNSDGHIEISDLEEFKSYSAAEIKHAQNLRVIIVGHFEEREMFIDIQQIPNDWTLEQMAWLLNDLYKQQFNACFKHPVISILIGRIQTKKLSRTLTKIDLLQMSLKNQLKEQLIVLEEQ